MNIKKLLLSVSGLGGAIIAGLLFKNSASTKVTNIAFNAITEPEKCYSGVPLSRLTELAKHIYHGLYCTIDQWGFLIFHYKSNRGHQTFHTQMTLDKAGKLINLGGHYQNQWWSGADEFVKRANEMFEFNDK